MPCHIKEHPGNHGSVGAQRPPSQASHPPSGREPPAHRGEGPSPRAAPSPGAGPSRAGQGRPGGPGAAGRCWHLWARSQAGAFSRLPPPAQPLRPSRGWVPEQELPAGQRQLPPSIAPAPPTLPQPRADPASPMCRLPLNRNCKSLLDPFSKSSMCFWGKGKNHQNRQHPIPSTLLGLGVTSRAFSLGGCCTWSQLGFPAPRRGSGLQKVEPVKEKKSVKAVV